MPDRVQYRRRKSLGLCTVCGQSPAAPPSPNCADCIQDRRARAASLKRSNLCVDCKADAVQGKTRCAKCLEYHVRKDARERKQRAATGKCYYCTRDRTPGMKTCSKCRAKRRERNREDYHFRRVRRMQAGDANGTGR